MVLFQAALLKVASRCNLNCDYCYVYHHADQSWKLQPHFMEMSTISQFATQLRHYVTKHQMDEFSVILHGGEPLLFTSEKIHQCVKIIRDLLIDVCNVSFSLQTNGSLLTREDVELFEQQNIGVSLSLDGPAVVNDLHRLDHRGVSSFDDVVKALKLLQECGPNVFSGVIAVIDPIISPRELFQFFDSLHITKLDLLLPDSTHAVPPPGKKGDAHIYSQWLNDAILLWFTEFPHIEVRWFDAILASRVGIASPTDAMGFGEVNLIVIETDGSYTDHDVFKITRPDGAALGETIWTSTFEEISQLSSIKRHEELLTLDGLAVECRTCPVVEACGGGSVMHRYHPSRGLDAPTVYCSEMFSVLSTATNILRDSLAKQVENTEVSASVVSFDPGLIDLCRQWNDELKNKVATFLSKSNQLDTHYITPGAVTLAMLTNDFSLLSGQPSNPAMHWLGNIRIQSNHPSLIQPFRDLIVPLPDSSEEFQYAKSTLTLIQQYIATFNENLVKALPELVTDILFVGTSNNVDNGIFSFSDDNAPGILYVAPYAGGQPVAPDDLADSILHEYFHQVLYHLELSGALLHDTDYPRFPAPWRDGLRPASGFLHGTYVFAGLSRFWTALANSKLETLDRSKCLTNAERFRNQAEFGIKSLNRFGLLTNRGANLVKQLAKKLQVDLNDIQAPGNIS